MRNVLAEVELSKVALKLLTCSDNWKILIYLLKSPPTLYYQQYTINFYLVFYIIIYSLSGA